MIENRLDETLSAIHAATQMGTLQTILRDSVSGYAIDCIVYSCLCDGAFQDNVTNLTLSHYGKGWMKRYLSPGDRRLQAIAERMHEDFTPFHWEPLFQNRASVNGPIKGLKDHPSLLFVSGITLPLYICGYVRHFINFISMSRNIALGERTVSALTIIAILARNKAQQLSSDTHEEMLGNTLSNRERQCIRWISAGKTDWETSRILGLSQKTVQNYVYSARRKLNAVSRAQAVKQALNLGII